MFLRLKKIYEKYNIFSKPNLHEQITFRLSILLEICSIIFSELKMRYSVSCSFGIETTCPSLLLHFSPPFSQAQKSINDYKTIRTRFKITENRGLSCFSPLKNKMARCQRQGSINFFFGIIFHDNFTYISYLSIYDVKQASTL